MKRLIKIYVDYPVELDDTLPDWVDRLLTFKTMGDLEPYDPIRIFGSVVNVERVLVGRNK